MSAHHAAHKVDIEELKKSVRTYIAVFVTLLVLTGLTVGVAYFNLPIALAVVVALLIAIVKGSLVALFFMHLVHEVKVIYWTLALCVVFFIFLIFVPLATESNQSGIVARSPSLVLGAGEHGHQEGQAGEH